MEPTDNPPAEIARYLMARIHKLESELAAKTAECKKYRDYLESFRDEFQEQHQATGAYFELLDGG